MVMDFEFHPVRTIGYVTAAASALIVGDHYVSLINTSNQEGSALGWWQAKYSRRSLATGVEAAASPVMSAVPPKAEVNSDHGCTGRTTHDGLIGLIKTSSKTILHSQDRAITSPRKASYF
jgi:hypothetical protein